MLWVLSFLTSKRMGLKRTPLLLLLRYHRCNVSLGALTQSRCFHQRGTFKIIHADLSPKTAVTSFIVCVMGTLFEAVVAVGGGRFAHTLLKIFVLSR